MRKETFRGSRTSLPQYQKVMKYSVVIVGIYYQHIVSNATS